MFYIKTMSLLFIFTLCILWPQLILSQKITDEKLGKEFWSKIEPKLAELKGSTGKAEWNYYIDINPKNEGIYLEQNVKFNKFVKELWNNVNRYDFSKFTDYSTKRKFLKYSVIGSAALNDSESELFTNITTTMLKTYSSATVCVKGKCNLELSADLINIMAKSRDYEELKEVWVEWRNSAGKPIREMFKEYVTLGNKAAVMNGLKTLEDVWLFPWETKDFKHQMEILYKEFQVIYKKIHAFVRMKLKRKYGNRMPTDGTIPAHILGNMWAQQWGNIFDLVVPFPEKKSVDVTETMKKQKYSVLRMFQMAEKFNKDLGLYGMNNGFWQNSMLTKPANRSVACHPTAWDFFDKQDYRIRMCTEVKMVDFVLIHHEMGHIQYYMLYKDQPIVFREGANPGFHEAIGDLMSLSVSTPKHLHKVGLLSKLVNDRETTLNYQMQMALEKFVFLPFGYLVDVWRWDIFSGKTNFSDMNKHWWELRLKYQGVSPPVKRTETDFDAGAKYHIPAGVEYIRYFVSFIIQFQFHKALCSIADPKVPLYECDIDGNKAAGKKLADVLKLGSSKPWPEQLEMLTGSRNMSAKPLVEYFDPLLKYLDQQIKNEKLGWINNVNNYVESPLNYPSVSQIDSRLTNLERNNEELVNRIKKLEIDLKNQQLLINNLMINQSSIDKH